jgi:serine/threonine protein kinase
MFNKYIKGQILNIPYLSNIYNLSEQEFIVDNIFEGGMGSCFQIRNTISNDIFALKMIHSDIYKDNLALEKYIFEIKTWLTLSSCNGVVEAICLLRLDEIPCVISRWMKNGNLRNILNIKEKSVFYKNIDRIISTLNLIIKKYNIIHRDLKPENILLDINNKAFITDWGIAKVVNDKNKLNNLLNSSNKISKEEVGRFSGSVYYASPEQIMGEDTIDHRSDIYSLGCIMYEWETGNVPFVGTTVQEILTKHIREAPRPFVGLFKSSNFKAENIIMKCLEKNPNNRYQTYDSLLNDIRNIGIKNKYYINDEIKELAKMPVVGNEQIKELLNDNSIKKEFSNDKRMFLVKGNEVDGFLIEADYLISIGENQKAIDIYRRIFISDLFKETPESFFVQNICINYSLAYSKLCNIEKAIEILRTIDFASIKPAEYFLNLSLYYLQLSMFDIAETFSRDGLKQFPNDQDIIGNLTIALTHQKKYEEALTFSKRRLALSKNVHSLMELSDIYYSLAEDNKNKDFPFAFEKYKKSYFILLEAKSLNPRFSDVRYKLADVLFKLRKYSASSNEILELNKLNNTSNYLELFYMARNLLWTASFDSCLEFICKHNKEIDVANKKNESLLQGFIMLNRVKAQCLIDNPPRSEDGRMIFIVKEADIFLSDIVKDTKHRLPSDFEYLSKITLWGRGIEESIKILLDGIKAFPNAWKLYNILAERYLNIDFDISLENAEKALKIAPWRENIYYVLSEIYKMKNDKDKFQRYFDKAREIKEVKSRLYNSLE